MKAENTISRLDKNKGICLLINKSDIFLTMTENKFLRKKAIRGKHFQVIKTLTQSFAVTHKMV